MLGKEREVLLKAVKEEKEKSEEKYNKLIREIKEEEGVSLFKKISKIYEGTYPKSDTYIKFLEEYLEDDFFKKAGVRSVINGIQYQTEDFKIKIPTSKSKTIVIEEIKESRVSHKDRQNLKKLKHKYEWSREVVELVINYLGDKSFENLRKLKEHEERAESNKLVVNRVETVKLVSYVKLNKYYTKEKLEELKADVSKYYQEYHGLKERIEKEDKGLALRREKVLGMGDLKKFKDEGFKIKVIESV